MSVNVLTISNMPAGVVAKTGPQFGSLAGYLWPNGTTVVTLNGTGTDGTPPVPGAPPTSVGTTTAAALLAANGTGPWTVTQTNGAVSRSELAEQARIMDNLSVPLAQRAGFKSFVQALASYPSGAPSSADLANFCAGAPGMNIPASLPDSTLLKQVYAAFNDSVWTNNP